MDSCYLGAEAPVLGLFVTGRVVIFIAAFVTEFVLVFGRNVGVLEVSVVVLVVAGRLVIVGQHKGDAQRHHQALTMTNEQQTTTTSIIMIIYSPEGSVGIARGDPSALELPCYSVKTE